MKKEILILVLIIFVTSCTTDKGIEQQEVVGVEDMTDIAKQDGIEELIEIEGLQEYTGGYSTNDQLLKGIEDNIDYWINEGKSPGGPHYKAFVDGIAALEETGRDVTRLRDKLGLLKVPVEILESSEEVFEENIPEEPVSHCIGKAPKFEFQPFNLDNVEHILPMGKVSSDHVAPTDHIYLYSNKDVDVYAPANGIVSAIGHMGNFVGDWEGHVMDDWHITIEHDCGLKSIFIHVDELAPKLAEAAPEWGGNSFPDIDVEAGELIGRYEGSVDYMVVDEAVILDFANLESYKSRYNGEYIDRVHISDPLEYFNDEIKSLLIGKSLRSEEPIGGLIDYDVPGRLIGTWFLEGTNGWDGLKQERYWADHLAIIYDAIDPTHVIVSIGTFDQGHSGNFGVKGNSPDPGSVGVGEFVKYELMDHDYYDGDKRWDGTYFVKGIKAENGKDARGVVLFELVSDERLKAEWFPNKVASEVNGFTENVKVFER